MIWLVFVKAVRDSGLVGLGGASFPTHIKYNPKNIDEVHTLIVNGAECEPFITSDHRTMLEDTQDIIDGMKLIMEYIGLDEGYIGIEENKPDAIEKLDRMFAEQGLTNMHTFKLQARYPKGAERVLVYEITGKPMAAGVLPADLGVILSNVTSVAFVGTVFQKRRASHSEENDCRRRRSSSAEEHYRSNRCTDSRCNRFLRRIQIRSKEDFDGWTDDGQSDFLRRDANRKKQ